MTENWKPIPQFEDQYEVSDLGRVRSLARRVRARHRNGKEFTRAVPPRILRPGTMNRYGHQSVALGKGNSQCVHALVLLAFVGPRPDGAECRHKDGNARNNRLTNLCWDTRQENVLDIARQGKRKFTYEQVAEIRREREDGAMLKELAAKWGTCESNVSYICRGEYYGEA